MLVGLITCFRSVIEISFLSLYLTVIRRIFI